MRSLNVLLNITALSSISAFIAVAAYLFNVQFLSGSKDLSPTDALFLEGISLFIIGLLLLLGRGGINRWSQRAAILSALAGAILKGDTVGPSEVLRRDRWKAQGFIRLAFILILAGVLMILIYFLTL